MRVTNASRRRSDCPLSLLTAARFPGRFGSHADASVHKAPSVRPRRAVSLALSTGLLLVAVVVALVVVLVTGPASAARSAYTQAHGEREAATVISAWNKSYTNKGITTWYGYVLVRLPQPVGGQAQTTVHSPDKVSYAPGGAVTVLVDPQSPGYAELPGNPMVVGSTILEFTIGASLVIIICAVGLFISVRSLLRSRAGLDRHPGEPDRRPVFHSASWAARPA